MGFRVLWLRVLVSTAEAVTKKKRQRLLARLLSIPQNGGKGIAGRLDFLNILQQMLNRPTIAATEVCSPGYDRPVCQYCSKGMLRSLQLLYVLQPTLYGTAVATTRSITPRDHGAIRKDGSKGRNRRRNSDL